MEIIAINFIVRKVPMPTVARPPYDTRLVITWDDKGDVKSEELLYEFDDLTDATDVLHAEIIRRVRRWDGKQSGPLKGKPLKPKKGGRS